MKEELTPADHWGWAFPQAGTKTLPDIPVLDCGGELGAASPGGNAPGSSHGCRERPSGFSGHKYRGQHPPGSSESPGSPAAHCSPSGHLTHLFLEQHCPRVPVLVKTHFLMVLPSGCQLRALSSIRPYSPLTVSNNNN